MLLLKSENRPRQISYNVPGEFVATGRTESITIPGAHPWDVAAGILLVREAGGKVTDYKGGEWSLKSKDMLASNGKIHNQLLKTLKKF